MSIDAIEYPIFVTSAWGTSPRMAADAFAAEHWAIPRRVAEFAPDGTFRLEGGTARYRVACQPGVAGESDAAYGVFRVESRRGAIRAFGQLTEGIGSGPTKNARPPAAD